MKKKQGVWFALAAVTILGSFGCSDSNKAASKAIANKGPVAVYTTNYPLKYFAERIGGEHVEVHFPAPSDVDPAYWMPDSETVSQYQQADLILLNGAGYEKWVDAVSLPKSKLSHTSAEFASEYIALENAGTHSHGPEGEHVHGGTAFTTWLDPTLALKQADAVRASLAGLRPEASDAFQVNFDALKGDLEALDQKIADLVAKAPDRPVIFSHPVYQYFIRRYSMNAKSVHWEPDEPPTETMWDELREHLKAHPAKWMIWEGEPATATAEKLAELDVDSVVFDPCGNGSEKADYLDTQRQNMENLARVFSQAD